MRSLIYILALILLSGTLNAKTIIFEWYSYSDASKITGFKLYKRKSGSVYNFNSPATYYFPSGSETTMSVNLSGPYFFVLKAFAEGEDCNNFSGCEGESICYSEPSNEVNNFIKSAIKRHWHFER